MSLTHGRGVRHGPDLAAVAALLGEPTRARILTALMSGIALTATELAVDAGVAPSTGSAHLAKLTDARVLRVARQGRHRYFRLFDDEIAGVVEALMGVAGDRGSTSRRTGPSDPALRIARVCYDHLAGERGVWLLAQLRARGLLAGRDGCGISAAGEQFFAGFGLDLDHIAQSRRVLARACLDWSERRDHLGGALGAAIFARLLDRGWAQREAGGRVVTFTANGARAFRRRFGAD